MPALPLGELGGCLGGRDREGAKKGPKLSNCVVQQVATVYQAKMTEDDGS